jgi:hypothetical protein
MVMYAAIHQFLCRPIRPARLRQPLPARIRLPMRAHRRLDSYYRILGVFQAYIVILPCFLGDPQEVLGKQGLPNSGGQPAVGVGFLIKMVFDILNVAENR